MKKINEGIEVFDMIWEKASLHPPRLAVVFIACMCIFQVYSAPTPALKEKHEGDLKKEIKKLQRFREQVKSWASSGEIKNKQPLLEARRVGFCSAFAGGRRACLKLFRLAYFACSLSLRRPACSSR
jgi:CCR4-NOT transcription complex subunit 3